jgi:hypothetical protein
LGLGGLVKGQTAKRVERPAGAGRFALFAAPPLTLKSAGSLTQVRTAERAICDICLSGVMHGNCATTVDVKLPQSKGCGSAFIGVGVGDHGR